MYISMLSKVQTSLNNFYDTLNSIIHLDFNIKSNRLILCTSDQKVKDLNDLFQYHLKSLLLQSVHNKQTVPIINMLQDIGLSYTGIVLFLKSSILYLDNIIVNNKIHSILLYLLFSYYTMDYYRVPEYSMEDLLCWISMQQMQSCGN